MVCVPAQRLTLIRNAIAKIKAQCLNTKLYVDAGNPGYLEQVTGRAERIVKAEAECFGCGVCQC